MIKKALLQFSLFCNSAFLGGSVWNEVIRSAVDNKEKGCKSESAGFVNPIP